MQAVSALTRDGMADSDPEIGANLMVFCVRDWAEVGDVPGIDGLVPGIGRTLARLEAAAANQYRLFRFEAAARSGRAMIRCCPMWPGMPATPCGKDAG